MSQASSADNLADVPATDRVMRRTLALLRPHPGLSSAVLATTLILTIATLLTPLLFGRAVDAVEALDEDRIIVLGAATIAAGVAVALLTALSSLLSGRLALRIEVRLRNDVFAHYLELDRTFFERRKVGQLVSLIIVTSTPIRNFVAIALPKLFGDAATFVFAGIAMAIIDWRLAAVSLWPLLIVVYLVWRMNRVVAPMMIKRQEYTADATETADETLRSMLPVEVLNAEQPRIDRFDEQVGNWQHAAVFLAKRGSLYDSAIQTIPFFAWAPLFVIGANRVIDGALTLGTFVTFTGYVTIMLVPLTKLGYRLWTTERATASAQRAFGVLDRSPLITDAADASDLAIRAGDIDLRGVSSSFGGLLKALDDVELDIAAGRNVAIVGPTGSGKTSLLNLISRVNDPDAGEIRVAGAPISALTLRSLRAAVRRVGSAPHLFPASVRDNLRYGSDDAHDGNVVAVCQTLGIHDEITALPDGYDTMVGSTGVEVSQAVAQGISIARAFTGQSDVLLLDDVTAPFSPVDEQRIARGIAELSAGLTVVVVAARPALLSLADDIVVLDRGALVGHGTFDDLARRSPHFRDLLEQWRLDRAITPPGGEPK
ncbi:MAG: ABC transporter ATP-binding protein [Actinomycetota bacterium]